MMNTKRLRRDLSENIIYLVLWATLFMAPVLGEYIRSTHDESFSFNWQQITDIGKVYLIYFAVFLIHNFFVAPILICKHRLGRYLAALAVLLIVSAAALTVMKPSMKQHMHEPRQMEERHMGPLGPRPDGAGPEATRPHDHRFAKGEHRRGPHKPEPFLPMLFGQSEVFNTFIIFLMLGMNLGVKLYYKNERDRKKMQLLKSQTLEQQLEHLRYQLNPHFFMNTLNNIHALIDIDSEQAKRTIVDLSYLMRYVLYEGAKANVPLQRDIAFMKDYIQLMKIRYAESVSISTRFPDDIPNTEVPPMLFISFIENAFKHGVSYQAPSFIDIRLSLEGRRLLFACRNSIHRKEKEESGGVGLSNIRQRLALLYGEDYTLDISEQEKEYNVSASIPLGVTNVKNQKP